MFCRNCGTQLKDDAMFCHNCGTAVNGHTPPPVQPQQYQAPYQAPYQSPANSQIDNTIAIVGFVFSFLIAIVGLICSIVGYNNAKRGAQYGGLALAGIIISIVSMGLALIITCIVLANYPYWYLI